MNKKNTRHSSSKLSLWIAFSVLATLLAVLTLLPSIISSDWGKTTLLSVVNSRLNGRVEIDKLALSWFNGQKIEGLRVFSTDNATIGTIETAQTETPFFPLIFGHISGQCEVVNLHLEIIPYTDGTTNLDFLLNKSADVPKEQKLPPIILNNVQIVGSSKPLVNLHLTGNTDADSRQGTFTVEILTLPDSGNIKLDAHITHFPVLVLDRLVALKNPSLRGSLLTVLGETLSIDASQIFEKNDGNESFSIYKILLNIAGEKANISLKATPGEIDKHVALEFSVQGVRSTPLLLSLSDTISLVNPVIFEIELSQDTLQTLTNQKLPVRWQTSSPGRIILKEFNTKYRDPDLLTSSLKAALDVQNIILFNLPNVGDIEILQASLESQAAEIKNSHVKLQAVVRILHPEGLLAKFATEPFSVLLEGDVHVDNDNRPAINDLVLHMKNKNLALLCKGSFTKDQELLIDEPATLTLSAENTGLIITVAPFNVGMSHPKIDTLQATIHSSLHPDNLINLEWSDQKNTVVADGSFNEFPIGLLSTELEAIFGANINGSLHLSIRNQTDGRAKVVLNGTNGSINIDARYHDGVLFLNRPVHGSVLVNERLAKTIIKKTIPFFDGLASADNPVNFRVEPDNFALPLFPFDLRNVSIGLATMEFGTMQFRNEGPLGKMLSILKPGKGPLVSLWFTPMYLHLQGGVVDVERVDLLVQGKYPIAAWGNIDLIKEKVDMEVGLSSYAIAHAFNVQIGDAVTYVAVPLRGPLKRPTFDKASATAQITGLVAQNQAGAPGMILGTVLQLASRKASNAGTIPPPTTNPLPWEGQIQMDQVDSANGSLGLPIKSVTEGAGKLIKKLLK